MKEPILDPLILALREQCPPPCPGTLEANVLRRLRLMNEAEASAQPFGLDLVALRSATVGAMVLVSVLLGATSALWASTVERKRAVERQQIAMALDFDVFRDRSLQASIGEQP
jgi:hypothetical protein